MDTKQLMPFVLSIIRHALVAGGAVEASRADELSGQLAAGVCALIGLTWSWINAHKSEKTKAELAKIDGE